MIDVDEKKGRWFELQKNTGDYINNYLDPYLKWGCEVSGKHRIDLVRQADVNWRVVADHIKGMNYQDFLATRYWKAIAGYTKHRAGYRCQLCNNGDKLSTHHRNYAIHGQEHVRLDDLIVLCNICHQKFHGHEVKSENVELNNKKPRVAIFIAIGFLGSVAFFGLCFILWGDFGLIRS